jgi:leucyl/phenylalanyl-tRNA--protein transferase
MGIPWLQADTPFPCVTTALSAADGAAGLLAAGADLSPQRLLLAYRQGIFPWFSEGQPILWWCTDPRMVLRTDAFVISASLKKTLKKIDGKRRTDGCWEVRFDSAFEAVIRACSAPRDGASGTWITDDLITGYIGLHQAGFAHSAELWHDGRLVGGAYGVCIGRMFYGESMFARVTDGSKIALAYLVHFLRENGVEMIDCQQETSHLASLGASPISRDAFIAHLRHATAAAPIRNWVPGRLYPE